MILLNDLLQNTSDANFIVSGILDFIIRFVFNAVTIFILIRYIFYPNNGQKELIFTYIILGLVVFLIAEAFSRLKMDFAFAIGLFAVFSIIRYRTPPFEVKEMTYLFAVIGISVINALVQTKKAEWIGFSIADILLLLVAYFMEHFVPSKLVAKNQFTFVPSGLDILNDRKKVLEELQAQTNLNVFKFDVLKINAIKKEVTLWIYYK